MNNEYHAVVHLFGKNSSDKQEFVRKVTPGQEIEIGLDLYKEVNRVLNFYVGDDNERFLGRVAFNVSVDDATAGSDISYMNKKWFYHTSLVFLNLTIVETINKKLLLDKKPLLIPDAFQPKGHVYSNESTIDMFTKASEFYEFAKAFGNYAGETESGVTWIAPINVYVEEPNQGYLGIIKSWISALRDVIHKSEVRRELDFTQSELKFIDAFIAKGQKVETSNKPFRDLGGMMRWIMDEATRQEGAPSDRVENLLIWTNHYNR